MKTKHSPFLSKLLLTMLLASAINIAQAQTSEEVLTKHFDQSLGSENLDINNGTVHVNEFRVLNNKHRYYPSDNFETGNVTYNNQQYFDIPLKYDLYKDILVYKPQNSGIISINLIHDRVTSFRINNRNFILINSLLFPLSPIKTGYYEENVSGKNFTFYIRHHRDKREVLKGASVFNEFDDNYEYFIKRNGAFNKISSKKDLIKLFPEQKRKINDFYSASGKLKKTDELLFYEKLITYLNNAIENNTK
ncbi:hypothetical protein FSS13T_03360 [Flavobacterium saliperosum S13]|uniref:DUF4468 domain-containing protein n=3 Tax=Flavobacterium saliperosum TaxID=329186 RepID=A0A1G4V5I9_9FLAO|nr:hypothetical protein FSS13T_03360 [Flavobacterium saliperosum S13]SCX01542.1 hypothetical protein SAMN02927925_00354 [Flavobacterium saliperosum]